MSRQHRPPPPSAVLWQAVPQPSPQVPPPLASLPACPLPAAPGPPAVQLGLSQHSPLSPAPCCTPGLRRGRPRSSHAVGLSSTSPGAAVTPGPCPQRSAASPNGCLCASGTAAARSGGTCRVPAGTDGGLCAWSSAGIPVHPPVLVGCGNGWPGPREEAALSRCPSSPVPVALPAAVTCGQTLTLQVLWSCLGWAASTGARAALARATRPLPLRESPGCAWQGGSMTRGLHPAAPGLLPAGQGQAVSLEWDQLSLPSRHRLRASAAS